MNAPYTGPERRWMTRSLRDWTDRFEQHDAKWARDEARSIAILEKMRSRALKRGRHDEADALWDGLYGLRQKLEERRERIARHAAPWFDDSVFERPSGPVVCSFGDELAGKAPPTFGPAAEGRVA